MEPAINDEFMSTNEQFNNSLEDSPEIKIDYLNQNEILNKNNLYLYKNNRGLCQSLNFLNTDLKLSPIKTEPPNIPETLENFTGDDPTFTESLLSSGFNESDLKKNDTLTPTKIIESIKIESNSSFDRDKSPIFTKHCKEKQVPNISILKEFHQRKFHEDYTNQPVLIKEEESLKSNDHLPTQMLLKNISINNFKTEHKGSPLIYSKVNISPIIHTSTRNRPNNLFKKINYSLTNDVDILQPSKMSKEFQYYPLSTTQSNVNKTITEESILNKTKVLETVAINDNKKLEKCLSKKFKSDIIPLSQFIKENDTILEIKDKGESKFPSEKCDLIICNNNSKMNKNISLKRPLVSPINSSSKVIKLDIDKNEFNNADISDTQMSKIFLDVESEYNKKELTKSDSSDNEIKNSKSRRQLCFNDFKQDNLPENILNKSIEYLESECFFQSLEQMNRECDQINDLQLTNNYQTTKIDKSKTEIQNQNNAKSLSTDNEILKSKVHNTLNYKHNHNDTYSSLNTTLTHQMSNISTECQKKPIICVENNLKSASLGFSTASGKKVNFSEKSLLKARKIFNESENEMKMNETPKSSTIRNFESELAQGNSFGFSTASGKKVNFSEKSLLKARKIFDETENETPKSSTIRNSDSAQGNTFGFSTASGKKVNFSEKSLLKARKIFDETENETPKSSTIRNSDSAQGNSFGFSTASGKKVNFSEKSLLKARKIFDETENETPKSSTIRNSDSAQGNTFGFSTASGKKVNFSEKSLLKARKIFDETENETPKSSTIRNSDSAQGNSFGFSTASGKKVNFSEKSLLKARKIFDETENETPKSSTIRNFESESAQGNSFGFSTASGKKVNFSEKSLLKARKIFDETENETPKSSTIRNFESESAQGNSFGFSTASGKKVNFSEKSLLKARKIFDETENETPKYSGNDTPKTFMISNDAPESEKSKTEHIGFSTASGRKVAISETNLNRAMKLYNETANEIQKTPHNLIPNSNVTSKLMPLSGQSEISFSTTSANTVDFSEGNVLKASLTETAYETPKSIPFLGFATSSGKKVNVLENNLIKAKRLFENFETPHFNDDDDEFIINSYSKKIKYHKSNNFTKEKNNDNQISFTLEKEKFSNFTSNKSKSTNLFEDDISDIDFCEAVIKNENRQINNDNILSTVSSQIENVPGTSNCLDNEVNEITAAFMEDEFKESKMKWNIPIVSEPDMIHDRQSGIRTPLISKPKSPTVCTSPILNKFDRKDKNKERFAKIRAMLSQAAKDNNLPIKTSNRSTSNFKVPYKTNDSGVILPPSNLYNANDKSHQFKNIFHINNDVNIENKSSTLLTLEEVKARREQARKSQYQQIALSRRNPSKIKPLPGSWYLRKQNILENHQSWKHLIGDQQPGRYSFEELTNLGVKENIIKVNSTNAIDFRFHLSDYYSKCTCDYNIDGIEIGDGSKVIIALDGSIGLEEISLGFLSSPGISPSLIPNNWIKNHYRWLIWKLSSMEKSFPHHFGARALTPNHLLLQMKYRYDRELDKAERPALRKIFERDDSSNKRMILCVASIINLESKNNHTTLFQYKNTGLYELELTDGWYSVLASTDSAMNSLITNNKISIGTKLIIHGAELLGVEEGCSPLEPEANQARLRLSTNSIRRARWDSKLGFYKIPGPMLISLSSILTQGGTIGRLRILVLRIYPLLYVEKLTDGKSVTRSERSEKQEATKFERKRLSTLEEAYSKARAELETLKKPTNKILKVSLDKLTTLSSGEDLCNAIETSSDPSSYQKMLNSQQIRALENYRQNKQEKFNQNLEMKVKEYLDKNKCPHKRDVSTLLKVRIIDFSEKSTSPKIMILNIWRPVDETVSYFKEGVPFDIFNVSCSKNRDSEIQLSSTRSTRYQLLKVSKQNLIKHRQALSFNNLYESDFKPNYGELDLVGLVVHLEQGPGSFETVYLTNEDSIIVGICFWGGFKAFSCDQLIKSATIIAASNLQWRSGTSIKWIPCSYFTELSTITLNPRANHLIDAQKRLRTSLPINLEEFVKECKSKVIGILKEKMRPKLPIQTPTSENSKRNIHQRISKLEMYCEPPSLAPTVSSKLRKRRCGLSKNGDFKPPKRKLISSTPPESPPLSLESSP